MHIVVVFILPLLSHSDLVSAIPASCIRTLRRLVAIFIAVRSLPSNHFIMPSLFSRFNPVPSFPAYPGPHTVGTLDVEIPTAELPSPSPAPDPSISTVSFRVFYPCQPSAPSTKPVYWLPEPQREYFEGYVKFLGASPRLSWLLRWVLIIANFTRNADGWVHCARYVPIFNLLSSITIPALRNASIVPATTPSKRWPVMVFSHGLGGTKNAYSYITGALASHGIVVVAPEHRDGSAPISIVHAVDDSRRKVVDYISIPHRPGQDVEDGRNKQLRLRLWELGLVHEALLQIDTGAQLANIAERQDGKDRVNSELSMFRAKLDVHVPGCISWSGHSFGAASMIQLFKSVFYHNVASDLSHPHLPLFTTSESSAIARQITPSSTLILFDLWSMVLRTSATDWLFQRPLPCYSPSGSGGSALLAVLSEAFVKWRANLSITKAVVFPPQGADPASRSRVAAPHVFYPVASAHMGQSDFGLLWPWLTRRVLKSDNPIQAFRLNVRAVLEMLRRNGFEVSNPSPIDPDGKVDSRGTEYLPAEGTFKEDPAGHDMKILATDGSVKGWIALNFSDDDNAEVSQGLSAYMGEKVSPMAAVVQGEVIKNGK